MPDRIFVAGYPGEIGGANTECWHTIKLWRRFGVEVVCLPTWPADLAPEDLARWHGRLEAIGVRTCLAAPEDLARVAGLGGAPVVAFCNVRFLRAADRFRALGCPIVWVGCMNWLFPDERLHYRRGGTFERYVFQSVFQRDQLEPQLRKFGYDAPQGRLIRGAFDCAEFSFRPRARRPGQPFVVGRLSRAAADKFHPDTWQIYAAVPGRRARVLGFGPAVEQILGPPPAWAEVLAPGAESPQEFLGSLHALVMAGRTEENWPRAGLEAMAAGVPVVADARGGWSEMIRHGRTGYLAENGAAMSACAARLAGDDNHRLDVARAARRAVEELSDPHAIWQEWRALFESLSA